MVLNADEAVRFLEVLEAVPSLKIRTALTAAYAAGLRASETVGLKVADIDSGRMEIRVEQGKGGKDDFVSGDDTIDLAAIDANALTGAHNDFSWVGGGNFTGMAGQLGFSWNADGDTVVHADLDGDTIADFAIVLAGWLTLDADDFIGVMA